MKQILVFGEARSDTAPSIHIGGSSAHVRYFSHAQIKAMPGRLDGYRPDLIINLSPPYLDLFNAQQRMTYLDGRIIDLS